MKYLYPYECERKGLSSPGELQAAIDSNRREGRRPSYSSSLFRFSPSPSTAPHILSPPKMHLSALGPGTSGVLNGLQASPGPSLKKGRHVTAVQLSDSHFWYREVICLQHVPGSARMCSDDNVCKFEGHY